MATNGRIPGKMIKDAAIDTAELKAGALAASVDGRAKIAAGFFDTATVNDKVAAGAIALDRLAMTVGNGLLNTAGTITVKPDVTTGGDTAPVTVGANGVGLDVSSLDGDHLDIDFNPTSYAPAETAEAADLDDLSAHLKGIDNGFAALVIGTFVQAFSAILTAISALATTGLIARTGAGTVATRSVAVGAGLSVANGDGVAGNPTVSPGTELAGLAALAANGIIERTAAGTYRANNADRSMQVITKDFATDVDVVDPSGYFVIPPEFDGWNIVGGIVVVITAGTTGLHTVNMDNVTKGYTDIFSTPITIDSTEDSSLNAATPAVVDAAKDDVNTGNKIRVRRTVVQDAKAKGEIVILLLRKP